jgi:hypothetical protein
MAKKEDGKVIFTLLTLNFFFRAELTGAPGNGENWYFVIGYFLKRLIIWNFFFGGEKGNQVLFFT